MLKVVENSPLKTNEILRSDVVPRIRLDTIIRPQAFALPPRLELHNRCLEPLTKRSEECSYDKHSAQDIFQKLEMEFDEIDLQFIVYSLCVGFTTSEFLRAHLRKIKPPRKQLNDSTRSDIHISLRGA
jgi:hypothetical protein